MDIEGYMPQEIKAISIKMPYRLGFVNCYLVGTGDGHILIDTGCSDKRADLVKELENAGCHPGSLKLIVLTHGDFDHTGNAAYLREKFGVKTAMHRDDTEMVDRGNMFYNRKQPNILIRRMVPIIFGFHKSNRFNPDLYIDDGYDFSKHGFDAKVISIPGHSKGSIGILTVGGCLFCGDLLGNTEKPDIWSIMDDMTAAHASVEKLKCFTINTVYPGHGKPFPMESFIKNHR